MFHVVATSVADSRRANEATVTVRPVKGKEKDKEKEKEKDRKEKEKDSIDDKIRKEKERDQPFIVVPVERLGDEPSNRLVESRPPRGQAFIRALERPTIDGG
jgi:hypothetical protein